MKQIMKTKLTTHITNNLFLTLKAAALLLAPALVYSQDLQAIATESIHTELASYMLAIPFLVGYLVYRKRKTLRTAVAFREKKEQKSPDGIAGVVLCFLALILYLYGSYTFYTRELHLISLPIFVGGCTLIVFNRETLRILAFPIAMLLMLVIPPLEIAFLAGAILSNAASQIAYTLLKLIGLPVSLNYMEFWPVIVLYSASGLPLEFAVQVASSGIYSLLGFTVFAIFAAHIIRGTFWKKLVTLFVGFPLIFGLNITRITVILLIGYWLGYSVAMDLFHIFGGWVLIFVSTFLLLFLSEKALKMRIFTSKTDLASHAHCGKNRGGSQNFCLSCGKLLRIPEVTLSKGDLVKVATLILSAFLITYIQVPTIATSQGPAELVLQTPYGPETSQILPKISNYSTRFMYRDRRLEQWSGHDLALTYSYSSRGPYPIVWVGLEISKARGPLHNPEVCYYMREQRGDIVRLDLRDVRLLQSPQLIARFYSYQVVKYGNQIVTDNVTETILYWFTSAAFDTGNSVEWKNVKISVWIDAWNMDYKLVEEELLTFGEAIASHWEPIESWSPMVIALEEHRTLLLPTAIALPLVILIPNVLNRWKETKSNLRLYRRLSDDDKLVFQAIHKAMKEGRPTINAIASAYQKLSTKPIRDYELLEKLKYAEEANLIRENIANYDDEPFLTWKPNFKVER